MPTLRAQQLGGIASAKLQRKEALNKYYSNPNHCLYCNKIIGVLDNQIVSQVKAKKFCNRSCSAKYNNKLRTFGKKPEIKKEHYTKKPIKDYYYSPSRRGANKNSSINADARKIAKKYLIPVCKICNYSTHVEVHHIKPISSFPDETPIGEVNSIDNLVYLCPTHHWEADNGLLSL